MVETEAADGHSMDEAATALIETSERPRWTPRALLDHLAVAVVVVDADVRLLYANRVASMFFGEDPEDWIDRDVFQFVHPDDSSAVHTALERTSARPGPSLPLILRARASNGDYSWIELIGDNQLGNPEINGIVLTLRDGSSQVAAEDLFRSAFESAPYGLAVVAPDGSYRRVNRALCELMGYPAEVLLTKTFQDLTHPDDLDADLEYVNQMLAGEIDSYTMEKRYLDPGGEIVWVELKVSLVHDPNGQPVHFVSQVVDIGDRKREEDRLKLQSMSDELTGLPNRRALDHALAATLLHGRGTTTVLFCDLDNMKFVNDTIGHNAGDRLLQVTAARIRGAMRPEDTVARFGGDEFVVVVTNSEGSPSEASLARRIQKAVEQPVTLGSQAVIPRISVGFATSRPNEQDEWSLLDRADAAMYAAKPGHGEPELRLSGRSSLVVSAAHLHG